MLRNQNTNPGCGGFYFIAIPLRQFLTGMQIRVS
jgi:hypothetical protein